MSFWFLIGFVGGMVIAALLNGDIFGCIALGIVFGIVGVFLGPQTDAADQD
jgi:hypothetical protein